MEYLCTAVYFKPISRKEQRNPHIPIMCNQKDEDVGRYSVYSIYSLYKYIRILHLSQSKPLGSQEPPPTISEEFRKHPAQVVVPGYERGIMMK